MKKITVLFVAFIAVMFSACSSDDKNDNYLLNGTSWEFSTEYASMLLEFNETEFKVVSQVDNDGDGVFETDREGWGSYTYHAPHITMTVLGKTEKGTMSGNKLIFERTDDVQQTSRRIFPVNGTVIFRHRE